MSLPRRAMATTAPGMRPWAISCSSTWPMRARRAEDTPSASGRRAGQRVGGGGPPPAARALASGSGGQRPGEQADHFFRYSAIAAEAAGMAQAGLRQPKMSKWVPVTQRTALRAVRPCGCDR